jgi:hypothetical protein
MVIAQGIAPATVSGLVQPCPEREQADREQEGEGQEENAVTPARIQRRHLAQRQGPEEQGSGRRHPSPIVAGMPSGVAEEERGGDGDDGVQASQQRGLAPPGAERGGSQRLQRAGMDGIQRGRRHGRGLDGKQRATLPAPGSVSAVRVVEGIGGEVPEESIVVVHGASRCAASSRRRRS